MININGFIDKNKSSKLWVVYILYHPHTAVPFFVGHCKLNQLFSFPDAYKDIGLSCPDLFMFRVTDVVENLGDALKAHSVRVRETGTLVDLARQRLANATAVIECLDTGEKWPTLAEAARAHGLGAGNLSKHLRGAAGFNTVKGRRYRRVPRGTK